MQKTYEVEDVASWVMDSRRLTLADGRVTRARMNMNELTRYCGVFVMVEEAKKATHSAT